MGKIDYFIGGVATGTAISMGLALGLAYTVDWRISEGYKIPKDDRIPMVQTYDVNGDGLDDVVSGDGVPFIKQENGSYISLEELSNNTKHEFIIAKGKDGKYYTRGNLKSSE